MSRTVDMCLMAARAVRVFVPSLLICVAATGFASSVQAQPTLSKVFNPSTMGPGSVSTITFTITNNSGSPVTGLAFTDTLPSTPGPMTIADPANVRTDCDLGPTGSLTAPVGGTTITLNDAQIAASRSCTIRVNVTANTPGAHTNPAVTLTSSAGSSMSLPVDLTVDTALPGFSKSFAPSTIPRGDRSTLTFTIDNSANANAIGSLDFTDNLPAGMVVANPANASTDCVRTTNPDTTLTAVPGSSIITLDANGIAFPGFEVLVAGATCTVTVDVVAVGRGSLDNVSGNLLADFTFAGKAGDTLTVTVTPIAIQKSFANDPVPPGGSVFLDFQLTNFDRNEPATGIAFTDDLAATLAGLTFDSLVSNSCGGVVTGTGTTTIGFTGGALPAQGMCSLRLSLSVPAGATPGLYTNMTSAVTGTIGGSPVVGNVASDDLFVSPAPVVTKSFVDDPSQPGDTVELEFTVTNTSSTSSATDIAFFDEFATILQTASMTPGNGCCGAGSTCTFTPLNNPPPPGGVMPARLSISDGILAPAGMAGDSCTFSITLDVIPGAAPGLYPNTTSAITATVDGATRTGNPATDDLTIIAAPRLSKAFSDDPVAPGGTVTLEFTLSHSQNASTDATGITFTDDLAPVLAGLTANLPSTPDPPCGPGSTLTGSAGDTLLTLMGGTLAPGDACTFSVTLDVPVGAAPGTYTNTTSGVAATVSGVMATSAPASDGLMVAGLDFTKEFIDDPVIAGDMVTLRFTIDNIHPTDNATGIGFSDNLNATLSGLAATAGPTVNTCGGTLSGTTFLNYMGGSVASGASCTIEVPLLVPAGASDGSYINATSSLSANQGGPVAIDPAVDILVVNSSLLQLTKTFTDDPVAPGDSVTLEFTLSNVDASQAASDIGFTDDLNATLAGLTFDSVLLNTCIGTVSGTGTTMITVSSVALAAAGSCTIQVSLSVPAGAAASLYTNTTSDVSGMIGGFPVTGAPATDELEVIQLLQFSKSFDGPTTATGTAILTFTITNPGADPVSDLAFSDDLNAVVSGLIAISLPAVPCGVGSSINGTSFLTFTGGALPPMGGMCSFDVEVLVPASATAGTYPNITSDLRRAGLTVAEPATADLVVEPAPTFDKTFAPDAIGIGQTSTLTFTIDNTASALAASSLAFTDNLPAGITVSIAPNASTTCTGGTLTATAGSGTISYTGGTVAAGASCTVQVDVMASAAGDLVNTTGDLTSSSGNSGTATDTLTVNPQPGFAKVFAPDTIANGAISTLTFTIDNTASTVPATALTFTDNLPAAVTVAAPANAANTCGGMVVAASGTNTISFAGGTVAAGATCTVSVDTTSSTVGSHVNTTGNLMSSLGDSGTATDTLVVVPPPTFAKAFAPDTINVGGTSTLTFTIDNTASTLAATGLAFNDTMPVEIVVASPANVANTCGGTVTATSGTSVISLTGGTIAAGAMCTVAVDVTSPNAGMHVNTTGDLTSSLGNSGTATDTLTANPRSGFSKAFGPDAIASGFVSTLTFTIDNSTATVDAMNLMFTDTMPTAVVVAMPANVVNTCTGGTVTATPGSNTIAYAGGSVAAGATCTLSVDVTSSTPGVYVNVTSDLTSSLGNSGTATDTLTVNPQPGFAKSFAPDTIVVDGTSTLTFTIDNTGSTVAATGLDFTDNLPTEIVVAMPAGVANTCTGGTVTATPGSNTIAYTGGSVAAGASCTLAVNVTSAVPGVHINLTGDLTSSLGNSGTATDALTVNPPPSFGKAFAPTVITAGDISTLSFIIGNTNSTVDATNLSFVDDLPGDMVVAMPSNASTTCTGGTFTAVPGSGVITYTGGSVAAGAQCTVQVDVTIDVPGIYLNTSGDLTSSLGNSGGATATLEVAFAALGFAKAFDPAIIQPGETSTLTLTIDNPTNGVAVGNLAFTDALPADMVVATPANATTTCVGGTLTAAPGDATISYTGGTVPAMASCTVSVDVTASTVGDLDNTTSDLTSDTGTSPPATATLTVIQMISLTKAVVSDPTLRGGLVDLTFTIANRGTTTLTQISFTDDLDAALSGMMAVGLPQTDVCGAGSQVSGTSVITFTGGSLAPAQSCVITVTAKIPVDAEQGVYTNTTSPMTALANGVPVTSLPSSADFEVTFLDFDKVFTDASVIGGFTTTLQFTIANPDPANAATGITFMDDLDAVLSGLMAVGLPQSDVCGVGSSLTGSSLITLTDGNLGPGETCTFDVTVLVPESAPGGTVTNVTSLLQAVVDGSSVTGDAAGAAMADLTIELNVLQVPTLGTWGALILSLLLGLVAVRRMNVS